MSGAVAGPGDVVDTAAEAARQPLEPLIVLDPLREYLDQQGLGYGRLEVEPIGEGHSNVTYLIARGAERFVLRRPPRGPLAPSANDVLREARLLTALGGLGLRVPEVIAACEDPALIGAPFYLMPFVEGHVLVTALPPEYEPGSAPGRIAAELVAALAALHAVGPGAPELAPFGRPGGYLERQLRRFGSLLEHNATRPLPDLEWVAEWLAATLPDSPPASVVHGDFRLGNMIYGPAEPRLEMILDWEMATIGDPLADLGYMTAMWAEPGDEPNPMLDLSAVTRLAGFPPREQLAADYAAATGRDLSRLPWYQVLAIWKSAIFLEGSYGRHLSGASTDPYFARLGEGVEVLAGQARRRAETAAEMQTTDTKG